MFLQAVNFILSAGSSVFMPLIILILGLTFGMKFGKAFKAGIMVGIAFVGITLVIDLFTNALMTVVNRLVDIYGFKLTVLDVGWATASSIAWSSGTIVPVILIAVFLTNILLIIVGWIKTLDVDIWNYWGAVFLGSAIYSGTNNLILATIAPCVAMALLFKCSDYGQPYIEDFYGLPGVTTCNFETMPWIVIGGPLNKLIDKIPGVREIDWRPEKFEKRLGVLGEPYILGLVIGAILALLARVDAKTVLNTAIVTSASMYLLPKMIDVLMEGFSPISTAAYGIHAEKIPRPWNHHRH